MPAGSNADGDTGVGDGGVVESVFWRPHASPYSVWTFVGAYPALILAVYRRDRRLLAGTLVAVVTNLLVVPPPETDDAWATRVVLGERAWIERGLLSSTADLGLVAVCAVVHLYAVRAAAKRRPVRTALGTAASMVLMVLFFGRMVRLYEKHGDVLAGGDPLPE